MRNEAIRKTLMITSLLIMGLIATSCGGNKGSSSSSKSDAVVQQPTKIESGPPVPNKNVKPLDLGIAQSFAILAYSSVTSVPTSIIKGKVGLKPGNRSLVTIDSAEIEGGLENIYSGDDQGDKAVYLTIAREEMISAYRDASARPFDKDKDDAYGGNIGGKTLPPGVYKWSNGVTVDSEVVLDGSSKDVWIFQVTGNVSFQNAARMKLAGQAKARNVFWQISGKVNLDANTEAVGTMISQLAFDMKTSARLTGRAFVKNGKLTLDQNTIDLP